MLIDEEDITEEECEKTGMLCPVMEFEYTEKDEPEITHVLVTKSGEVFFAVKSLELEETLSNGDLKMVIVIDTVDFPEDDDRSIITIDKDNIDYTQQPYHRDTWLELMRFAFCTECEAAAKHHNGITGIYQ